MVTTPTSSGGLTCRPRHRSRNLLWSLTALTLLSGCLESKPEHPILALENLGADDEVAEALAGHGIEFSTRGAADVENYLIGLMGERYDAKDVLTSEYVLDWENTTAYPNVAFHGVPLAAPVFLTDEQDHLYIVTAGVGNFDGVKGEPKMDAFNDGHVMELKATLQEQYGTPEVSEESYRGHVYFWRLEEGAVRLTIENECLCKQATRWPGGERPQGGRGGDLTVYYSPSLPEFHDESQKF